MTYTPKHRGEPKVVWRVFYVESERGWGRDEWHVDFEDEREALDAYDRDRSKGGPTPDYYCIATHWEIVTL